MAHRGRADARALPLQIRLDGSAKCLCGPRRVLGFVRSGVLAVSNLGVKVAGNGPRFGDVDCRDLAKCDALGPTGKVVLEDPRARAALANADAKAADIGIEVGNVGPAPG